MLEIAGNGNLIQIVIRSDPRGDVAIPSGQPKPAARSALVKKSHKGLAWPGCKPDFLHAKTVFSPSLARPTTETQNTPERDIGVHVNWRIVQVRSEHSGIRFTIPVATAQRGPGQ